MLKPRRSHTPPHCPCYLLYQEKVNKRLISNSFYCQSVPKCIVHHAWFSPFLLSWLLYKSPLWNFAIQVCFCRCSFVLYRSSQQLPEIYSRFCKQQFHKISALKETSYLNLCSFVYQNCNKVFAHWRHVKEANYYKLSHW